MACTGGRGPSMQMSSPGPTRNGPAASLAAASSTNCISARSREGTLMAAIDRIDHLVRLGVDFVELMQIMRSTVCTIGATTACSGTPCTKAMGRARLYAVRRCVPSSRSWSDPGRRLQPSRSKWQLLVTIGAYLRSDAGPDRLGQEPNLDGEGSSNYAATSSTTP